MITCAWTPSTDGGHTTEVSSTFEPHWVFAEFHFIATDDPTRFTTHQTRYAEGTSHLPISICNIYPNKHLFGIPSRPFKIFEVSLKDDNVCLVSHGCVCCRSWGQRNTQMHFNCLARWMGIVGMALKLCTRFGATQVLWRKAPFSLRLQCVCAKTRDAIVPVLHRICKA